MDPLDPFLFLVMADGLSGLVERAKEIGIYLQFRVGSSNLVVSDLRYVNDTVIMEDYNLETL